MKQYLLTLLGCFGFMSVILSQEENVVIERYNAIETGFAVKDIWVDNSNTKWIATEGGLYKLSDFESEALQVSENACSVIYSSRDGDIWAAFDQGRIVNVSNNQIYELESKDIQVTDLVVARAKLYVATSTGIYIYHKESKKRIKHLTTKNSKLLSDHVNFLHEDIYGDIRVGTKSGFHTMTKTDLGKCYNKEEDFQVIAENNEGLWIVTDQEMHFVFSGNRWSKLGLKNGLADGRVNDLSIDSKGKIYFSSNTLVRLDPYPDTFEAYGADVGMISGKCLAAQIDKYNQLWIGTEDAGLFRLKFADNEAALLTAACIVEKAPSCHDSNDGRLKVTVSGGEPPYKYNWNARSIRGNNPKRIKSERYEVTVTDQTGLEYVTGVKVEAPSKLEIQLVASSRVSGPRKKDGSADITVTGGTLPYSYDWSSGEETEDATKLKAGRQYVTVVDGNKCSVVFEINILKEKYIPDLDIATIEVGQTLRINELYFEADSTDVKLESHEVLDEVFSFMFDNPGVVIEIGGHTNGIPSHEYCDRLSSGRAKSVAEYLYNKGISADRIKYKGYGKRKRIASDDSLAGRQKNQRVEVKILDIGK